MKTSPELENFALWFLQDMDILVSTEEEMFAFVLKPLKGEERVRLGAFLDEVTQDSVSDTALQSLRWAAKADIVFRTGSDLRAMLRKAHDRL